MSVVNGLAGVMNKHENRARINCIVHRKVCQSGARSNLVTRKERGWGEETMRKIGDKNLSENKLGEFAATR